MKIFSLLLSLLLCSSVSWANNKEKSSFSRYLRQNIELNLKNFELGLERIQRKLLDKKDLTPENKARAYLQTTNEAQLLKISFIEDILNRTAQKFFSTISEREILSLRKTAITRNFFKSYEEELERKLNDLYRIYNTL